MKILVTGGAGFVGSAVIRHIIGNTGDTVINLDKLTYAGNLDAVGAAAACDRYYFERADIGDEGALRRIFAQHQPDAVMHLAAESHVDRSIGGPAVFMETNIIGSYRLLEAARHYWRRLAPARRAAFRFHHVSTDEVYGDLGYTGRVFSEEAAYCPSSPYSASKASSDHLARAWHRSYGLPVIVSHCTNNYGPWQHAEKLIPMVIDNALAGRAIPVYGDGRQVRDWLYVDDNAAALYAVLTRGRVGQTYDIGGCNEQRNIDVIHAVCAALEAQRPSPGRPYTEQITHVSDRPGHDQRYAMDITKIRTELGWSPSRAFEAGLAMTVEWFLTRLAAVPE